MVQPLEVAPFAARRDDVEHSRGQGGCGLGIEADRPDARRQPVRAATAPGPTGRVRDAAYETHRPRGAPRLVGEQGSVRGRTHLVERVTGAPPAGGELRPACRRSASVTSSASDADSAPSPTWVSVAHNPIRHPAARRRRLAARSPRGSPAAGSTSRGNEATSRPAQLLVLVVHAPRIREGGWARKVPAPRPGHNEAVADALSFIEKVALYPGKAPEGCARSTSPGWSRPRAPTATPAPGTRTCTPTSRSRTRSKPPKTSGCRSSGGSCQGQRHRLRDRPSPGSREPREAQAWGWALSVRPGVRLRPLADGETARLRPCATISRRAARHPAPRARRTLLGPHRRWTLAHCGPSSNPGTCGLLGTDHCSRPATGGA